MWKLQRFDVEEILKYVISNENVYMLIQISIKFVRRDGGSRKYFGIDHATSHLLNLWWPSPKSTITDVVEDVVEAALTGDAPITSEWSTVLLPIKMRLLWEIWR